MKIAIQDSWPNLPENAEKEFIQRFHIACSNLGIASCTVITSQDIADADPDVVLVSHEFSRKLTDYPTIGLVWSPTRFFGTDPYRLKSLLSYDGYAVANERTRVWLEDHTFGLATPKPVSDAEFLPTTYRFDLETQPLSGRLQCAAYVGVHWDGDRHADLFKALADQGLARFFGPATSWAHVGGSYGGFLPFDGRSVLETLAGHAAVLCLHKDEHREENTPSMRIFEACSVGAIPICDDIDFAREHLSGIALFVDMDQSADRIAEQVSGHLEWIAANPEAAASRAERGRSWFENSWSLEARIERAILPLCESVMQAGRFTRSVASAGATVMSDIPQCEVVIRTGGRDLAYLERALQSVRQASSPECRVDAVVVDYKSRLDVASLCAELSDAQFVARHVLSADTGYRSTALWTGIQACVAPFVAHLDDDDTVAPNHYRQLVAALDASPRLDVAYSGVVLVQDEPDTYFKFPNYDGPVGLTIAENRDLKFLDAFDLVRLARFDNFIQSNAWLARRDFIHSSMGADPKLIVVEDVYLYLLMAAAGPFTFTGSPTAYWHWRSPAGDNSMFAVPREVWREQSTRVRRRLSRVPFIAATLPSTLAELPNADWQKLAYRASERLTGQGQIDVGSGFEDRFPCENFHPLGDDGQLWSRERTANITLGLSPELIASGCVLNVSCRMSEVGARPDRWLQLSLSSGSAVRLPMPDGSSRVFTLEVPADSIAPLTLGVTASHLSSSPAGTLSGGRVESFEWSPTAGFVPARSGRLLSPSSPLAHLTSLDGYGEMTGQGSNTRLTMDAPGVILLGHGSDISAARVQAGETVTLPATAHAARWFLAIPDFVDQPERDNKTVAIGLRPASDKDFDLSWSQFDTSIEGRVQSYFADAGGSYEHVSFMVAGQSSMTGEAVDDFFLIQRHNRQIFWEVRPSYGPAWGVLSPFGVLSRDGSGQVSRGEVGPDVGLVTPMPTPEALQLLRKAVFGLVCAALETEDFGYRRLVLMALQRLVSIPAG